MFTRRFWLDAVERGVRTAAQGVLVAWGVGDGVLDAFTLDWKLGAGVAAGGFVSSVLTSLVAAAVRRDDSAALV